MSPIRQRGVTLIELMVALAVGLAISFAVTGVLGLSAASKGRTHASGDINQVAGYVQMTLDRAVRSAGAGFGQDTFGWGCPLQASKSSTQILPVPSPGTLPAPFASVTTGTAGVFRLAPVVIGSGQTTPNVSGQASDVLIVMSGQSGQAEVPMFFTDDIAAGALTIDSGVGMRANDVLLLADRQLAAGSVAKPCLVTQVSSSYSSSTNDGNVALSGSYYAATINSNALTGLSIDSATFNLGNTGNNPPLFQVIGVGNNNTLYSHDLLQFASSTPQAIADGVFELKALYGIDTTGDGSVDSWQSPTGSYALATLMNGTAAAAQTLYQIKAIRVGLILRSSRAGKSTAAASSLALFSDLGSTLTYTRTLTTAEQKYRYRTVEFTVPIVNAVLPLLP